LLVDLDPQANATQGMGVALEDIRVSVAELIRDRALDTLSEIYEGNGLDLIPSSPLLAKVEREMVGTTNSELRLAQRLVKLYNLYSIIILDTPPTLRPFGTLSAISVMLLKSLKALTRFLITMG